uniref:Transmembrane protein 203 n=1 Tax=Phocoena sinus TaxID=42100 RepID=A0A8C9BIM0_PHOSS
MLFALGELVQLLGFAPFEVFVQLMALSVFSVLLALRVDGLAPASAGGTCSCPSSPLTSSAPTSLLSFPSFPCASSKRLAVLHLFWVLTVLSLKLVFEMLLCQKLVERTRELWFGLITSPVFILLQLLMIPACRINENVEKLESCWWECRML